MLWRATRRCRANDIEHIFVELKASKAKIGANEIIQAKLYAMAASKDDLFDTVKGVRWHFWILSNSCDDFAKGDIEGCPGSTRYLIHRKDNDSVEIKTWSELIEENHARLQFFQEHLQHSADEGAAIRSLQNRPRQNLAIAIDEDQDAAQ